MKKKFNTKARFLSLAVLAAGAAVSVPAFMPSQVMAADTAVEAAGATSATVTETEKKTVTRTVRFYYKDDNGNITPVKSSSGSDYVRTASATFERTVIKDKDTGKVISAPEWGTTQLDGFDVPVINGYTPDIKTIPAVTVSPDSRLEEIKVYYTQNPESKKTVSTESQTVSRRITYYRVNDDGSFSQTWAKTQSATFTRSVVTDGNGKKEYGAWAQHTFDAESVAPMEGYTPDITVVPAVTFTPDNPPADVKVYFRKNTPGSGGNHSGDVVKAALPVKFTDGMGKIISDTMVEAGRSATAPAAPTREGYTFAGWDKDFSNVQTALTVNATWKRNATETIKEVKHVERKINYYFADGTRVIASDGKPAVATQSADFTRFNSKDTVTGKITYGAWTPVTWDKMDVMRIDGYTPNVSEIAAVTFTPDNVPKDINVYYTKNGSNQVVFKDVDPSEQFYKQIYWAAERGITTGTNGYFSPYGVTTREQVVTFLWRYAGRPNPKNLKSPFTDVKNTASYSYKAILWAAENNIVTGTNGRFYPASECTREQIVTMIWRMAGKPAPKNMTSRFSDFTNSKSYSYKAVMWAAENGITTGTNGKFFPTGTCKRRETVTFIYRYAHMK